MYYNSTYKLKNDYITDKNQCKDLVVTISTDLAWFSHCSKILHIANSGIQSSVVFIMSDYDKLF